MTAVAGKRDEHTTNSTPSDVTGAVASDSFAAIFTGVTFTATQER